MRVHSLLFGVLGQLAGVIFYVRTSLAVVHPCSYCRGRLLNGKQSIRLTMPCPACKVCTVAGLYRLYTIECSAGLTCSALNFQL